MGILFSVIWSSAFTSARILMSSAPPFLVLSLRFMISGLLAITIARLLGQNFNLSKQDWAGVLIFGFCQNVLNLGLNFVALQWIDASMAAIIASMLPLVVAAISWIFFIEKPGVIGVLGLVAGMAGVLLIMIDRTGDQTKLLGFLLCSVALLALAGATLLLGNFFRSNKNILMIVGLQMFVGFIFLLPLTILFEKWLINWSMIFILSFIYQILMPGVLGTLIWFLLVKRIGATKSAAFHFLNPFFGVLIAAAILAEKISLKDGIAVVIIMSGILAVQISLRKRKIQQ
tara:strand:- start:184 stop:1044 length:861 start_codon:yes stop_codon:yes gene_type:complete